MTTAYERPMTDTVIGTAVTKRPGDSGRRGRYDVLAVRGSIVRVRLTAVIDTRDGWSLTTVTGHTPQWLTAARFNIHMRTPTDHERNETR